MYLESLALRLALGAAALPEGFRAAQAAFLAAAQQPDGGFPGRRGESDCYYTGFGLRAMGILGALDEAVASRAAGFLATQISRQLPPVDFLSLVNSAVLLEAAHSLDVFPNAGLDRRGIVEQLAARLRRDDGGYAKTERSGPSSTYQTFLLVTSMQSVGIVLSDADATAKTIRARQQPDGGFSELTVLHQSGTNPTAAAVGVLKALDALPSDVAVRAADYLRTMQTDEGGVRANARTPVADLLSTFTGLVALSDLDALPRCNLAAAHAYVESLALSSGGLRGGTWDNVADVEYTFYGVGSLALIHHM